MALVGIRNFEFRVPPRPNNRAGRYTTGATPIVIGAPVKVVDNAVPDAQGRLEVALATGTLGKPKPGIHGILVFEPAFDYAYDGLDRNLFGPSDLDKAPVHTGVQLVNGDDVKFTLRNTDDENFLHGRTYAGRMMVAGAGATPTLAIGEFICPGTGNDSAGYWAECNEANAWAVVVGIDTHRGEVDARLVF